MTKGLGRREFLGSAAMLVGGTALAAVNTAPAPKSTPTTHFDAADSRLSDAWRSLGEASTNDANIQRAAEIIHLWLAHPLSEAGVARFEKINPPNLLGDRAPGSQMLLYFIAGLYYGIGAKVSANEVKKFDKQLHNSDDALAKVQAWQKNQPAFGDDIALAMAARAKKDPKILADLRTAAHRLNKIAARTRQSAASGSGGGGIHVGGQDKVIVLPGPCGYLSDCGDGGDDYLPTGGNDGGGGISCFEHPWLCGFLIAIILFCAFVVVCV